MIISIAMTIEFLEFMELYDRSDHHLYGEYKLSHLEVGKLLRCWTTTDKYGNTYHRNLTSNMREHLVLGRDYVIVRNERLQTDFYTRVIQASSPPPQGGRGE